MGLPQPPSPPLARADVSSKRFIKNIGTHNLFRFLRVLLGTRGAAYRNRRLHLCPARGRSCHLCLGLGFGVWDLGFGVWGLVFGVWDLEFGAWGVRPLIREKFSYDIVNLIRAPNEMAYPPEGPCAASASQSVPAVSTRCSACPIF